MRTTLNPKGNEPHRSILDRLRPFFAAIAIYLASRGVIALAIGYVRTYLPTLGGPTGARPDAWHHALLRWDSDWYAGIARGGYAFDAASTEPQNVVFYPLYPLLARAVAWTGGVSVETALLLGANLAGLTAALLLFALARKLFDETRALLAVAFLAFWPGALFLSAGYTEPLALALILACMLCLHDGRTLAAAACAGLAAATRSTGIVLLPVILLGLLQYDRGDWVLRLGRAAACILLAVSGLFAFAAYLGWRFGAPLAFSTAQDAYHGGTHLTGRLANAAVLEPMTRLRLLDPSPAGVDSWAFLLMAGLAILAWRRLPATLALLLTGLIALPYLTLAGGPSGVTSMARFSVLAFPAFLLLADVTAARAWLAGLALAVSGALLFFYAALFAHGHWVA